MTKKVLNQVYKDCKKFWLETEKLTPSEAHDKAIKDIENIEVPLFKIVVTTKKSDWKISYYFFEILYKKKCSHYNVYYFLTLLYFYENLTYTNLHYLCIFIHYIILNV